MVAPNLLVVKHRTTPTQLGSLSGGTTVTQIGTNVTSAETWASPQFGFPSNRAVWFKGAYFAHINTGVVTVHNYDPVGNTLFNNLGANDATTVSLAHTCTGLFVTRATSPIMFYAVSGSGNTLRLWTTSDGRNWTVTTLAAINTPLNGIGRCVLYRDQLYCVTQNGPGANWALIIINPTTLTMTTFDFSAFGWSFGSGNGSLCVFRNRLFLIRTATVNSSSWVFYEFTGGTFVQRNVLLAGGSADATTYQGQDHFLFPVGDTKMVAIMAVDTGNSPATRGTKAWDLVPNGPVNFTVTEKTSTLIPTSLRTVADGGPGVAAQTHRWTGFVDNDFNTTPNDPKVYIWLMSNFAAGTYSYYEYIDSDTMLGPGTTGPTQDTALPYGTSGGGERTYSAGVLKAIITSVVPSTSPGRMRIRCAIYGEIDPSTTSTNTGRPPTGFVGRRLNSRAATTAALPAVTYANGASGVGATLTATANGAIPAQDDVTLNPGDRLLVKNQASTLQNGIYTVTQVGNVGAPFILTRATDFDTFAGNEIYPTAWTFVTEGTTLANTGWYYRAANPDLTIGTSAITFAQIQSISRLVRLWYSTAETPNMLQATLAGTPVFLTPGPDPQPTRNGDQLENIVADGGTTYEFDWDVSADALQNGQPVHVMLRPGVS